MIQKNKLSAPLGNRTRKPYGTAFSYHSILLWPHKALWSGLCLHHILLDLGGEYLVSTHLELLHLARRCLRESFTVLARIHIEVSYLCAQRVREQRVCLFSPAAHLVYSVINLLPHILRNIINERMLFKIVFYTLLAVLPHKRIVIIAISPADAHAIASIGITKLLHVTLKRHSSILSLSWISIL